MIKVLFICHGNICRSPMAEFIFKKMVSNAGISDKFYIASAAVSNEEHGNPVYPPCRKLLNEHGIDCSEKRAVQIKKSDYDKYDYIMVNGELEKAIDDLKAIITAEKMTSKRDKYLIKER